MAPKMRLPATKVCAFYVSYNLKGKLYTHCWCDVDEGGNWFGALLLIDTKIYLYFVLLGKSIPSRNPEVANISPGFPSDSVKHRPEGTKDDFTGTGSFASGKQPSNTAPRGTQKGIVHLGKHVSKKVARLLKSRPHLLASFNKELKDTSDHSSKVRLSVTWITYVHT